MLYRNPGMKFWAHHAWDAHLNLWHKYWLSLHSFYWFEAFLLTKGSLEMFVTTKRTCPCLLLLFLSSSSSYCDGQAGLTITGICWGLTVQLDQAPVESHRWPLFCSCDGHGHTKALGRCSAREKFSSVVISWILWSLWVGLVEKGEKCHGSGLWAESAGILWSYGGLYCERI